MTVGDLITRNARKFPHNIALRQDSFSIEYSALNERVNRLANALSKRGLKKGERIGVLMHNTYQSIEIYFSAAKTGCIFCPYSTHLMERELADILHYSAPRILFFDEEFKDMINAVKTGVPSLEYLVSLQEVGSPVVETYENLISEGEKSEPAVDIVDDDVMSIFFTSGTTSTPKGAMRTHRQLITTFYTTIIEERVFYGETVLLTFPFYHVSFEENMGRCFLLPNTAVVRGGPFDPKGILETMARDKITICMFAPSMINLLLQHPGAEDYDLSALRLIIYVGAPMPVDVLKKALTLFGRFNVGFSQHYGQTESGPFMTLLPPEDHVLNGPGKRSARLASAGRPAVDVEIKVVDEGGNELPHGQVGEIIGRGETIMKGYWGLPEVTKETIRNGWLYTGDLGKMDEDGYLYLVGRKGDMIVSGGKNIYPRDIEEVLHKFPGVFEAAVIGVPDDFWGEAAKALIVMREGMGATEAEIMRFCATHLAAYKRPKSVEFVKELPKNPQGKILKRVIRDRYWKDTGRSL